MYNFLTLPLSSSRSQLSFFLPISWKLGREGNGHHFWRGFLGISALYSLPIFSSLHFSEFPKQTLSLKKLLLEKEQLEDASASKFSSYSF